MLILSSARTELGLRLKPIARMQRPHKCLLLTCFSFVIVVTISIQCYCIRQYLAAKLPIAPLCVFFCALDFDCRSEIQ